MNVLPASIAETGCRCMRILVLDALLGALLDALLSA